ncbi:MAG TPA: AMP-binding protein [Pseudolysinimonas sp.]|nr:AMP-binding protein [Pseudolysinimonas sp.]
MTRELRIVPADGDVLSALRDALGGGPALFVADPARPQPHGLPAQVERRIALVVETSGSTGRPKRVALGADAVLASAAASESALGGPGQWVLALPTHYIAGLNVLARAISSGFDLVAVEGEHFTPAAFVAATARVTEPERFVSLVPAQVAALLDDPDATQALRSYTRVLVGGQAMPATLRSRAEAAGIRITRTYGSSETCGGCVYDGHPIGQTVVRVDDGEVWLGGPTLAEGYLGDPQLTAERFVVADGLHWFRTADAGTWDGERLTVTGRRDDVIVSGGVKVALGEIERRAREVYADAVAVATAHERWGQAAVIVTADPQDRAVDLSELGPAARQTRVLHVESIPMLPSGKPDRVALAALVAGAAP